MTRSKVIISAAVASMLLTGCMGNIPPRSEDVFVNKANTVKGIVANTIQSTSPKDWTVAALSVKLTKGTVYNGNPDNNAPMKAFWAQYPALEFETWFGVPGDQTGGIAGGAGDVGGGPLSVEGNTISISWFNTSKTNFGPVPIANVSLTHDAMGTWRLARGTAAGITKIRGTIQNGKMIIDTP